MNEQERALAAKLLAEGKVEEYGTLLQAVVLRLQIDGVVNGLKEAIELLEKNKTL